MVASAGAIASAAIWSAVISKCGDIVGVWIDSVIAQVMITLSVFSCLIGASATPFATLAACVQSGVARQPISASIVPAS